ncbi:ABC transporter ATP-binding protein [Streptomyces iconiensis]|uniref:ABC transporter ATP-binding protein n=1 Tax=Streptomyces iconiensis TaxID=1384038 RepID=A0ABT7A544_9ACTN|nr:ABC transporter ATP-binding protein [Streptomyces iconiensis]MDJ1136431.1 ABC transporter ATP-binding protein [Streptomyces iconiensis]
MFGGKLRYDQAYVRHEGALIRMSFWEMAQALPRMVALVVRAAWEADRRALAGVVLAELGQGLASAYGLVAVNGVLTSLFAGGPTPERLRQALPALVVLAVMSMCVAVLAAWSVAMSGRLEPQVERAVSTRYYTAVTRVELVATEEPAVQRVLEAGKFGTDSARRMLGLSVGIANALIGMVAAGTVLASLHPLLLPTLLGVALPKGWGAVRSARREYTSRRHWIDHRRAIASLLQYLTMPHAGAEIRAHGAGELLLRGYGEMSASTEAEQRRLARAQAHTDLIASALSGVAALGAYGMLWWLLTGGGMPLAVGGTAVIAIRNSTAKLSSLVMQLNRMYEEMLLLTDTQEAIDMAARHAIPESGADLPEVVNAIRVDNVSFTYPGAEKPALDAVSLSVPRGKVIALVGANGSGKTTLAKILAGLMLPGEGRVWWEGGGTADDPVRVEVRDADRRQLFEKVALLGQDYPRWQMSARTNITIGDARVPADGERLETAARDADARHIVDGLPHGWDSIVVKGYERGTQISGGQWQKLAHARIRYRGAAFVLVDEPTSALDPHAEIETFARLRRLTEEDTTVVLITHRLAATATADHIYVLDRGRLVEDGDHGTLMGREGGLYRSMYQAQAAQYDLVPTQAERTDGAVESAS